MSGTLEGGCHCGAVRYRITGAPEHVSICHCTDCRRHAGAPMVGWAGIKAERFSLTGPVTEYASSELARRYFCPTCGTGLYYVNERILPGLVDIQTGTLDNPAALPPQLHVQAAERLHWLDGLDDLPAFERYPG